MKIFTGIILLASMGFLNYERAEGVIPHFPVDCIAITMRDGCTADGQIRVARVLPHWLELRQSQLHPGNDFAYYMRMPGRQYRFNFNPIINLFERHNATRHTPRSVQIHIRFLRTSEFYMANAFQVYNSEYERSWFPRGYYPADNYIYVAVPGGKVHRALLRRQYHEKDDNGINSIYPGIPGPMPKHPESPGPKRQRMFRLQ